VVTDFLPVNEFLVFGLGVGLLIGADGVVCRPFRVANRAGADRLGCPLSFKQRSCIVYESKVKQSVYVMIRLTGQGKDGESGRQDGEVLHFGNWKRYNH
jgi:hypothetical protein